VWDKRDNIRCSGTRHPPGRDPEPCPFTYIARDSREQTMIAARAHGWHLFEGVDQAGRALVSHLCPRCLKVPKAELPPAPPRLAEDQPLW
jgi:hypothetical protein